MYTNYFWVCQGKGRQILLGGGGEAALFRGGWAAGAVAVGRGASIRGVHKSARNFCRRAQTATPTRPLLDGPAGPRSAGPARRGELAPNIAHRAQHLAQ